MTDLTDRVRGGVLGLLVGDALGVPYEFHAATALPTAIEMVPPAEFARAHRGVPPGTWSDDGAQALCLLASLLERGRLDVDDFGRSLVRWNDEGYMAVDGVVFDIGVQTGVALRAIRAGVSPSASGPADERSNGNGSLMRVLPLAIWHQGDDRALVEDAYLSCLPTHGHVRSKVCCALYCLWARRVMRDERGAWQSATAALRAILAPGSAEEEALEFYVRPDDPSPGRGSGYVVDSLRSARACIAAHETYDAAVLAAIRLGDDTDTTACITGGIAGLRGGERAIPARWLVALRGRALVDPLLDRIAPR